MGIIELLQRVGEDNVKAQLLSAAMTDISTNRKGTTRITFETEASSLTANEVGHNNARNVGIVLWIPADLAAKARREGEIDVQVDHVRVPAVDAGAGPKSE